MPLVLAAFFALPIVSSEFVKDALGSLDITGKLSSFLGVLTGFFIAALAPVATFGKQEMDDPMPSEPPVRLEHTVNTETYFENLSRRQFLSFLFGYIAFLALVLYVVGYVYLVTDKYWLSEAAPNWRPTIFRIFWCVYVFSLANLLSNTLLGLFYLTDRIHRPNRVARWEASDDSPQK
ncbi:hypothetical protein [Bradyrhizobium brasilense]|uniref:Uncharacterized protein n=1 Tax=Bradyrhizobium brasilense TaxID=1419277 RepID=A0ABY8JAQ0_9BRAD|nr:hypothetical protein [Bradyrhizobium brasilense]WFU62645.1 hypothetical protein QA636_35185 [Bradyrhizobium brasilense]